MRAESSGDVDGSASGQRLCLGCGYVLEHLPEARCPECGRGFDPDDPGTFVSSSEVSWSVVRPTLRRASWVLVLCWVCVGVGFLLYYAGERHEPDAGLAVVFAVLGTVAAASGAAGCHLLLLAVGMAGDVYEKRRHGRGSSVAASGCLVSMAMTGLICLEVILVLVTVALMTLGLVAVFG